MHFDEYDVRFHRLTIHQQETTPYHQTDESYSEDDLDVVSCVHLMLCMRFNPEAYPCVVSSHDLTANALWLCMLIN